MTTGGKDQGLLSDINVTPFVDVMLVLLIIFMVTAPMMMQGVDVALPETSSGAITSEKEPLVITIDKEGRIFISDFQLSLENLREKLGKILEGRTDREVYLRADKAVPYGVVVGVMAEAKEAGVEKLGMVTEPVSGGAPETRKK